MYDLDIDSNNSFSSSSAENLDMICDWMLIVNKSKTHIG